MFFYSLICAAVLFVMWKNIAEEHEHYKVHQRRRKISRNLTSVINPGRTMTSTSDTGTEPETDFRSAHQYSIDCSHANTGLFSGIFIMVLVIISLIVFFVLITSPEKHLHAAAITVASLTELSLYCLTSIAVLIGMCQVCI